MHKVASAEHGHLVNTNTAFAADPSPSWEFQRARSASGKEPVVLNSAKAGCRLRDWTQRVYELDFKTCEIRAVSRHSDATHELGFCAHTFDHGPFRESNTGPL